jgi:hypothetical protein
VPAVISEAGAWSGLFVNSLKSSTPASRLINPDNYASIAGALADEEVGNAIAGDWVKVNDVFYSIITTSPTVEADFLLIGNVTQLQLESKTVSWAQVTSRLRLHYRPPHRREHLQLKHSYQD